MQLSGCSEVQIQELSWKFNLLPNRQLEYRQQFIGPASGSLLWLEGLFDLKPTAGTQPTPFFRPSCLQELSRYSFLVQTDVGNSVDILFWFKPTAGTQPTLFFSPNQLRGLSRHSFLVQTAWRSITGCVGGAASLIQANQQWRFAHSNFMHDKKYFVFYRFNIQA